MSRIFRQKEIIRRPKSFDLDVSPSKLKYSEDVPARIVLENGDEFFSSCLQCPDTPCLKYTNDEIENITFPFFPQDNTLNVCPTEALSLDGQDGFPIVESERCIGCGLCVSRCPYGAIFFNTEDVSAVVNTETQDYIEEINTDQNNEQVMELVKSRHNTFRSLPKEGYLMYESDGVYEQIYKKINEIKVDAQFPNILTRNLLIQADVSCSIRRKGDVNLRMDGVLGLGAENLGVIEVELSSLGILDSPRNMLDNIAVLNSRYAMEINKIEPLIITLSLPSNRTEFYRVINDVENVLGIQISTVTIGALLLLLWNHIKLNVSNFDFYIDSENISIREKIEKLLEREINVSDGLNSIFEPDK